MSQKVSMKSEPLCPMQTEDKLLSLAKQTQDSKERRVTRNFPVHLLGVKRKFEQACPCLEGKMKKVCKELDETKYQYGENEVIPPKSFWSSEKIDKMEVQDYEDLLESVITNGNVETVAYLLCYLSKFQPKPDLPYLACIAADKCTYDCSYTNVVILCHMFEIIDKQERITLYRQCYYPLITHLWNSQSYKYKKIVDDVLKTDISLICHQGLFTGVAEKIIESDCDNQYTFVDIWKIIGKVNKANRVENKLLPYLFQFAEENIKEILTDATSDEKKTIADYVICDMGLPYEYCKPSILILVAEYCYTDHEGNKPIRDIMVTDKGIDICTYLLSNGKFKELQTLFNTVGTPDNFKNIVFQCIPSIFPDLCSKGCKDSFDEFLVWYYSGRKDADDQIKDFKEHLVLSYLGLENIIHSVSSNKTKPEDNCRWVQYVKELMKWGEIGEDDLRAGFQEERCVDNLRRRLCVNFLVEQKESGLISEFLDWCFQKDKNKIDKFKENFMDGDKAVSLCVEKIELERPLAVKNFLEWVSLSREDLGELFQKCKTSRYISKRGIRALKKVFDKFNS